MNEARLASRLGDVSDEYRPVMMWFWNAKQTAAEIRRQIADFHTHGIRQFFVHPAYGLETEYLSEEFFEHVNVAVAEARRLGMRFWIYDEYAWPSGTAGGSVIRDYPDDRMMMLACGPFEVPAGETVSLLNADKSFAAIAVASNTGEVSARSAKLVATDKDQWTNTGDSPARFYHFWTDKSGGIHPSGRWAEHSWKQEGSLDGCSPQAVRHFLEATHEKYVAHCGDEFGKTIVGVFIDEPVLSTGWVLELPQPYFGLPWHRDLPEQFARFAGYDLRDRIQELVQPIGNYRQTRCDFWRYLAQRFGTSFLKQIQDWCRDHRIELTGHINAEEGIQATLLCSGDFFELLRYFDAPGCDSVTSKQGLDLDIAALPGKMASSVAHQLGRPRVMCETYTGSGWDMSFTDMKRIFDRLAVLGINMVQFMGAYYSIKGFRKLPPDAAWPPSHGFQNAQWRYYGDFSDYVSRVTEATSQGRHAAQVAVFYPIVSAWTEFTLDHVNRMQTDPGYGRRWEIIEGTFLGLNKSLLESQVDYDVLFEQTLAEAKVENGTIAIAGETYRLVIMPACTAIGTIAFEKLKQFAAGGGAVVFINGCPTHTDKGVSIIDEMRNAFGLSAEKINSVCDAGFAARKEFTEVSHPSARASLILSNELELGKRAPLRSALREALDRYLEIPAIDPPSPDIWLQSRQIGDVTRYCLINISREPYVGNITFAGEKLACTLTRPDAEGVDPLAGNPSSNATQFGMSLHANDLVFLSVEAAKSSASSRDRAGEAAGEVQSRLLLADMWEMNPDGQNIYPLKLAAMPEPSGAKDSLAEMLAAAPASFAKTPDGRFAEGVEPMRSLGTGWGQMCGQFPLTAFLPGKTYWVRADFTADFVPDDLNLVIEQFGVSTVAINGQEINSWELKPVWDESNTVAKVAAVVKRGTNTLLMRVTIPNWEGPHSLPMVALTGSFELTLEHALMSPRPTHRRGDWRDEGYPTFAGTMKYRQKVDIPEDFDSARLQLQVESAAEAVELRINNQSAGPRLWAPYTWDVSRLLKQGNNLVELLVTGTSANLFYSEAACGLLGRVSVDRLSSGARSSEDSRDAQMVAAK